MAVASRRLLLSLSLVLPLVSLPAAAFTQNVSVRDDDTAGPFPSNRHTVVDFGNATFRRVNLPRPDCAVRVSDCQDIDVINTLHATMPAMRDAWTVQNQRFLGASALDTYHLMTNFPVNSVEDLRGRKILAPGPSAAWLEGTGAVAVDGGLTTYYTQIQTGVADGVLTILSGAAPYRIHEVAPYITLVGLGSQVTGAFAVNLDTWNRLPEDVRNVLEALGPEYSKAVADDINARSTLRFATVRGNRMFGLSRNETKTKRSTPA